MGGRKGGGAGGAWGRGTWAHGCTGGGAGLCVVQRARALAPPTYGHQAQVVTQLPRLPYPPTSEAAREVNHDCAWSVRRLSLLKGGRGC